MIKIILKINRLGGRKGFDKVVWQAEKVDGSDEPALKLTYTSKDGEEDYPGTLKCTVTYTLTNNSLRFQQADPDWNSDRE